MIATYVTTVRVEAEQWHTGDNLLDSMGYRGDGSTKPYCYPTLSLAPIPMKSGDWVVHQKHHPYQVVSNKNFKKEYTLVEEQP